MYWTDLRKGRDEPMKKRKYLEYEAIRKILKQRQSVISSPERRDEIEQLITLLDHLAFKSKARWRVTKAYPHWLYCSKCNVRMVPNVEMVEKYGIPVLCCPSCGVPMERRDLSYDLFSTETVELDRPEWIPVTPETMPPYESETRMYSEDTTLIIRRSGQLLIRAVCNSQELLYTGYYEEKEWYSCVNDEIKTLPENVNVTHWMSAKKLLKGVEDNAEIH